jgi:ABC-type lipoprotein release transport system permease subunit
VNALAVWVRLDLRRRARSLAVLALLVALTTATVLTAVAGARRGSSAVDRLLAVTKPATIAVLPNEPGFDWDAVAAIPGVEAIARFPLTAYEAEGLPAGEGADFPYADPSIMDTIERPVVLDGRLADPQRDDEVVVTQWFEGRYGKGVGDTVTIKLFTPEQIDESGLFAPEGAAGPRIEARIVGVVRSGWFSDGGDAAAGRLIPSYGLYANHEANLLGSGDVIYVNALVRLAGGGAAIPEFREQLAEVSGRRDIEFFNLVEMAAHADEVGEFEANSLLAFALAAGIAAVFLVGQSVTRYAAGSSADLEVLRAFGMSPTHVRTGVAVGPFVAAVAGAAIGGAVAVALSPRFPMGTVAPLEPNPGRDVDAVVLAIGLVAVPLLVGCGALLAASRSAAGAGGREGSVIAAMAGRWGAPVPVLIGARFALERGRGSQAVPVRPALVGAVVGVLGVVGALTFAAGVSDAAGNPARFGQVWELETFFGFNDEDFLPSDDLLDLIAADPDVVAVNDTRQAVGEAGLVDVSVFALDPVSDVLDVVLTDGRLPTAPDEMALGPASADDLGARVGDSVELVGTTGGTGSYRVTGIAFVPSGSHNDYDSGAWVGRATYDELFDGFKFHTAQIAVREGADAEVVAARLGSALADAVGDPSLLTEGVRVVPPPSRLAELEQVRRLPLFLAAFLAVLAVGAVGHALATAVRRRRHDIAVLRALGVTRGQCRGMVVTQASLLALVGLVVGLPLGIALGRTLWRTVAESTPVDYVTPVALWLLILIAPVALLIANLLAAWPSQRAASLRVGHVLRAE